MRSKRKLSVIRNQQGFTLVELAIVVGLIGIMMGGLFGVPELTMRMRANTDAQTIPAVVSDVQAAYHNRANFAGLTIADAITWNLIPEKFVSGATATNQYDGAITLAPDTNPSRAILTWGDVGVKECLRIAASIGADFDDLRIGGTSVVNADGSLDYSAVGTRCNAGPAPMAFIFGK